jgi:tetratricopeptide (TPR) repeat protein
MIVARVWRAGAVAVLAAVTIVIVARTRDSSSGAPPAPIMSAVSSERPDRDVQIRVWRQALDADPASAIALGQLAALHLQRAREVGAYDDYLQAETYARRSLEKRTHRNASTSATLVAILLAQHRFVDARAVAESLVVREPDVPEYRAVLGEVAMELGDDALATRMFRSVWSDRGTLMIAARLARWLEITGHVPEARRLLVSARAEASARRDVTRETKAWFALRVGDLELRDGRLRAAEAAIRAGLLIEPGDPRLLAAMARLATAQERHQDVITWGEAAIGLQLDPATLGLVGDAYAARGDSATSAAYFHALEVAVSTQPGAYHRAWSLYLLDHGLRVSEVLTKAKAELSERKDVYGWDVYAWALYKSGRHTEARAAMKQALRLGTPDPLLRRHAETIGGLMLAAANGA